MIRGVIMSKGSSLYIKGDALLTIFGKYLQHKKIDKFQFFDGLFDELIQMNLPEVIKRIEYEGAELPENTKIRAFYKIFRDNYVEKELEKIEPQYSTLSHKRLEELKKKIINP